MKKKLLIVGLLSVVAGLGIASCTTVDESSAPSTSELGPSGSESLPTTSEDTDVVATRVKITQPGILTVGDQLVISEVLEFEPEGATIWGLESQDTDIAVVDLTAGKINIVGPGRTQVKVTNGSGKTLGNINIVAMSEEGKALQEFIDGVTNNYRLTGTWKSASHASWADLDPDTATFESESLALVLTENYVLDWVYGAYSAVRLQADEDKGCYSYSLLDDAGEPLNGGAAELALVDSLELGDRASEAYINMYFVMDQILDVTQWEEVVEDDGSSHFAVAASEESDLPVELVGSAFGMQTSSFTGYGAEVKYDSESRTAHFTITFDDTNVDKTTQEEYTDAALLEFDLTDTNVGIAVLDDATENLLPPAPLDVSGLAEHFAAFNGNFTMEFEVGIFNSSLSLLSNFYTYNTVGGAIVDDDTMAYYSQGFELNEEQTGVVLADPDFTSFYVNKTDGGVYLGGANENGELVNNDEPINGSAGITDPIVARTRLGIFAIESVTQAALETASLNYDETYGMYSYDATFDNLALGAILGGSLSPISYKFFDDPKNAQYIFGYIWDSYEVDGTISLFFAQRVRLSETESGYQGVYVELSKAGTSSIDVGDNLYDAFGFDRPVTPDPVDPDPVDSSEGE